MYRYIICNENLRAFYKAVQKLYRFDSLSLTISNYGASNKYLFSE